MASRSLLALRELSRTRRVRGVVFANCPVTWYQREEYGEFNYLDTNMYRAVRREGRKDELEVVFWQQPSKH